MISRIIKALVLTTTLPTGCGAAQTDYIRPTSNKPWFPHTAYYINAISGSLYNTVDETIVDLENRTGERFMHAAPVADMDIKILYGDLEDDVIGLAETWSKYCRITMSNKLNPESPAFQRWSKKDFAGVLRHEIGHCFGMEHSEDPNSIMFWQYHPGVHLKEQSINNFVNDLRNFRNSH
jgi:hypothetical protein